MKGPRYDHDYAAALYLECGSLTKVAAEVGVTKEAVRKLVAARGLPARLATSRRVEDRERKRADVRRRREEGGHIALYALCSRLGYVPRTTELQRDYRTLYAKVEREARPVTMQFVLQQVASDTGLPRPERNRWQKSATP